VNWIEANLSDTAKLGKSRPAKLGERLLRVDMDRAIDIQGVERGIEVSPLFRREILKKTIEIPRDSNGAANVTRQIHRVR
jgi:hypothetical protein